MEVLRCLIGMLWGVNTSKSLVRTYHKIRKINSTLCVCAHMHDMHTFGRLSHQGCFSINYLWLVPKNLFITRGFLFSDICRIGFDLLCELCFQSRKTVWVPVCSLASKQGGIGKGPGSNSSSFRAASVTGS